MMNTVFVTTSWDDGHILDLKLAELLKKYSIKGTFYIASENREISITDRLNREQILELSHDFEIGAHTLTHARLPKIADNEACKEIVDSKEYLEGITGQPITAFCYPRGEYRKRHVGMVGKAGFSYARTVRRHSFDFQTNPLEAETTINTYNHWSDLWKIARFAKFNPIKTIGYFQWDNLAKAMFDRVSETGGEYHLWGHSWEIEKHGDWEKLESVLAHIARKKDVHYVTNGELAARRPKRLLIATSYFPPYFGGVQLYAYHIAKRLKKKFGWEICVATSGKRGFRTIVEQSDGMKIYRLPYWFKISNTPINPLWPFMLKRIIKNERIMIINAHAPVPFMSDVVAIVAGNRPFILTYHTGTMRKINALPNWLIWFYEHGPIKLLLRRADFIICSSDFVRLEFLEQYRYKSATITPAVDAEQFKPSDYRTKHPTVLFVGGLSRSEQHKGLNVLIDAFDILQKIIPDLRLAVVGDGNMRNEYETSVQKRGLEKKITFRGKLDARELVLVYQQSDIFVLPSLAPAESFGMVLIEAMASGIPVIGSRVGGIPLVVDHEKTGLLVDSGDSQALALAMKRLLEDHAFAKRLGEAALQKVRTQYNWETQAAQYNDLLKNAQHEK